MTGILEAALVKGFLTKATATVGKKAVENAVDRGKALMKGAGGKLDPSLSDDLSTASAKAYVKAVCEITESRLNREAQSFLKIDSDEINQETLKGKISALTEKAIVDIAPKVGVISIVPDADTDPDDEKRLL